MKARPFSVEQAQEYEWRTARLSPAARGVWTSIRMRMAIAKTYVLEETEEQLGLLLRCPSETLLTVLEEFRLKPCCGLTVDKSVDKPPGNGDVTPLIRLCNAVEQAKYLSQSLSSLHSSLRVSKYRESKKISEIKRMPEHYELSEIMKDFGARYGMSNATVTHEFEAYKTRHAESLFTDKGWEILSWKTWVLNWVKWGRTQVCNGNGVKPPPYPGKHDPIARNSWRQAYGDPKQYGYE